MMTQTHVLVAAALLARPGERVRNIAAIAGGFVPDLPIYALWAWSKFAGIPESVVWGNLYWNDPWDSFTTYANSLPIYAAIAMLGLAMRGIAPAPAAAVSGFSIAPDASGPRRLSLSQSPWTTAALVFGLAAISHLIGDFFVHVKDAHSHFWPFTLWRFESPVSYWDPNHHGQAFAAFETLLGIGLAILLFRRFRSFAVRGLLALLIAFYIAVPVYFSLIMGHH